MVLIKSQLNGTNRIPIFGLFAFVTLVLALVMGRLVSVGSNGPSTSKTSDVVKSWAAAKSSQTMRSTSRQLLASNRQSSLEVELAYTTAALEPRQGETQGCDTIVVAQNARKMVTPGCVRRLELIMVCLWLVGTGLS